MSRRTIGAIRFIACATVFLAATAALMAQAPQALQSVAGKYQGTVEGPPGKALVTCELKFEGGKIVGTIQPGQDVLTVTGATLSGNTLTLDVDVNGNTVPLTGTYKDGRFEASALGNTFVLTKVDPNAKPAEPGPAKNTSEADAAAVKQAAYDYAEGYYEGAADRMERALHPALAKKAVMPAGPATVLLLMNAEMLIEGTRAGGGSKLPAEKRNLSYALLDMREDVASARIFSSQFNDYLHLVKVDGKWRLANVLWQPPSPSGVANAEADRAGVADVLKGVFEAMAAGDATRVERLTHPEASLRTFAQAPTKRFVVMEGNRESTVERVRQKRMPAQAAPSVTVLDVYDNIASAMTIAGPSVSYWHLAKQNGEWRVVNRLAR
jgi:hypothetical protein